MLASFHACSMDQRPSCGDGFGSSDFLLAKYSLHARASPIDGSRLWCAMITRFTLLPLHD